MMNFEKEREGSSKPWNFGQDGVFLMDQRGSFVFLESLKEKRVQQSLSSSSSSEILQT
jgi:hypothetical protein